MLSKVEKMCDLDVRTPVSLFFVFLVVMSSLGMVSNLLPFETKVFGVHIAKHVSDIMTEHEAFKSIFVLTCITVFVGILKQSFLLAGSTLSTFTNKYVVLAPTNFLVSLVFVALAITITVFLFAPKPPGAWTLLFFIFAKNGVLAISLITSLVFLNAKTLNWSKLARRGPIVVAMLALHFTVLSFPWS